MSVWLWLMLIALLVLPVLLRVYVGDEPRNDTGEELAAPPDEDDPDALLAAA
jgi:hypothetical protein